MGNQILSRPGEIRVPATKMMLGIRLRCILKDLTDQFGEGAMMAELERALTAEIERQEKLQNTPER